MLDVLEELIAKLDFWKAKNFVVLNKHYEFMLDLSKKDEMAVRILKKYPGVIVEYSNIHMSADNLMAYDVNIVANPNLCKAEGKRFNDFTAAIFRSILLGSIEHAKGNNENGNTNLVESDAERVFHEEDLAVSEERVSEREPRKKSIRRNKRVRSQV